MSDAFDRLIEPLLDREGGYVDHKDDRGGETNFGITKAVARENGFTGPMRSMTREQARAIYRAKYWAKPGLYLVAPLSERIAEELFDTGVNMGTGTAGMFLQRALNALNLKGQHFADLRVDGAIGPATAKALQAYLKRRGREGETVILRALNCLQGARYIELAEAREANESFVHGWLAHRVEVA